ncbi:hypothetical protein [Agromyces humi]|uniref:hypothetical protein n=1 Tax=Agromyces humi TaxID=1766800 RepID=UPI001357AD63|nr:hypothetical protein [Agromyces humi]
MPQTTQDARGNLHSVISGEFAQKHQTAGAVTLDRIGQERAAWLVDDQLAALPAYGIELDIWKDDDALTPAETNQLLAGQPWKAHRSAMARLEDRRRDAAEQFARNLAADAGVDFDQLHSESRELIVDKIEKRNLVDPIPEMNRITPDRTLRAPLGDSLLLEAEGIDDIEWNLNGRRDVILGILARHGVDRNDPAAIAAATELAASGIPWHGNTRLDIVWDGAVDDAKLLPSTQKRRVSFEGVHLSILDANTAQTSIAKFDGRLDVTFDDEFPAEVDRGSWTASKWEKPESLRPAVVDAEPTVPPVFR